VDIAIPIFDGLTALDAIGPYEVLSRLPDARIHFLAAEAGPKRTENRMLTLIAERPLDDMRNPEVIVMPGGHGTRALMHDEQMLAWVRAAHETSRGPRRCAPARSCSGPPGSSTGSRRPRIGR